MGFGFPVPNCCENCVAIGGTFPEEITATIAGVTEISCGSCTSLDGDYVFTCPIDGCEQVDTFWNDTFKQFTTNESDTPACRVRYTVSAFPPCGGPNNNLDVGVIPSLNKRVIIFRSTNIPSVEIKAVFEEATSAPWESADIDAATHDSFHVRSGGVDRCDTTAATVSLLTA